MFDDPADETTFVSILDALHRWRTHSRALDVDSRRLLDQATLMGAFPQLGTRMEKEGNAIQLSRPRSSRCDRRHMDIKRLLCHGTHQSHRRISLAKALA